MQKVPQPAPAPLKKKREVFRSSTPPPPFLFPHHFLCVCAQVSVCLSVRRPNQGLFRQSMAAAGSGEKRDVDV